MTVVLLDEATQEHLVVGLMSGSSGDGVDAALVRITDCCERAQVELVDFVSEPFSSEEKERIFGLFDVRRSTVDEITLMNVILGELFARGTNAVLDQAGVDPADVALVGVWPQMVYHYPGRSNPQSLLGYTTGACLQLGDLNVIAERTGITTVGSFCARDIAAGGNGAPLTGLGDYVLYHHDERNRAVQNIGGIANVNLVPADGGLDSVIGFDTGPGNMVIDATVRHITGGELDYDRDGKLAAAGQPDSDLVARFLEDSFIQQDPPKAAGRENFGEPFAQGFIAGGASKGLSREDVVASATALTVEAIALNYERHLLPKSSIDEVIVGGGGALNPELMRMLRKRLEPIPVAVDDDYGIPSAAKEAIYMALLAKECALGHANNVPSVTGGSRPVVMGLIAPAPLARA
ncbi:MAG: anhydro-N-acetylmuramic acid kinase [Gaiellaceae bacterium]|nr:anhydro-N-acetylmuramic acid kinase [Gaiellaceae bacterium]